MQLTEEQVRIMKGMSVEHMSVMQLANYLLVSRKVAQAKLTDLVTLGVAMQLRSKMYALSLTGSNALAELADKK